MNSAQTLPIGQIWKDEFSVISQKTYVKNDRTKYIEQFQRYHNMGTIKSAYQDDMWFCYSGVRKITIVFAFSKAAFVVCLTRRTGAVALDFDGDVSSLGGDDGAWVGSYLLGVHFFWSRKEMIPLQPLTHLPLRSMFIMLPWKMTSARP